MPPFFISAQQSLGCGQSAVRVHRIESVAGFSLLF